MRIHLCIPSLWVMVSPSLYADTRMSSLKDDCSLNFHWLQFRYSSIRDWTANTLGSSALEPIISEGHVRDARRSSVSELKSDAGHQTFPTSSQTCPRAVTRPRALPILGIISSGGDTLPQYPVNALISCIRFSNTVDVLQQFHLQRIHSWMRKGQHHQKVLK